MRINFTTPLLVVAFWLALLPVGAVQQARDTTPEVGQMHMVAHTSVACRYEDSNGCVWNAKARGNGVGRSFIATPDGRVIYISHKFAAALLG